MIVDDDAANDGKTNDATNDASKTGKNDDATNVVVDTTPLTPRVRKLSQKGKQAKKQKQNDKT